MLNGQVITLEKGVQYKVLKSLEKSGQADIWEVKQLDNDQRYALKIINHYQFGHIEKIETLIDSAQAEIDFLSSLSEPIQHHIVPCVDAGMIEQVGYRLPSMIIPLYQKDNLASLSKKISNQQVVLTGKQWLVWFKQLMSVLYYIQQLSDEEMPLVHRNIQPKNCLLDANHQLFLTDFSLVKKNPNTHKNAFIDSFDYCAPEQILAQYSAIPVDITVAVDIYAVAVVMYELVAGRFQAQDDLNHFTIRETIKNTDIGGLDDQEVFYAQDQLITLFSTASDSSKTFVVSDDVDLIDYKAISIRLVTLLQAMLSPLPQDRPSVSEVLEQLTLVAVEAGLEPLSNIETKTDIPTKTTKDKQSYKKDEEQDENQDKNQDKKKQDTNSHELKNTVNTNQQSVTKETHTTTIKTMPKENHYFSGEWSLDTLIEKHIIGSQGAVLTLQRTGTVMGDIKCNTLYIEENASVTGNIYAYVIHVDGEIMGDVYAHTLIVGSQSQCAIKGNVNAIRMLLNGAVDGDIYILDSLELFSQAKITGNHVYFQYLNREMGAVVNSRLIEYTVEDSNDDNSNNNNNNNNFPFTEQLLSEKIELVQEHKVGATYYFTEKYIVDSSVEMQLEGKGNAPLIINRGGGAVIGDITCYALYIEHGASVTGTINCHSVYIDGEVLGDIYARKLVIGSKQQIHEDILPVIKGQVKCDDIELNGVIDGDVHVVDRAVLFAQTNITGGLYYNMLEMKSGARVGHVLIVDEDSAEHGVLRDELNKKTPVTIESMDSLNSHESSGSSVLWVMVIVIIVLIFFISF